MLRIGLKFAAETDAAAIARGADQGAVMFHHGVDRHLEQEYEQDHILVLFLPMASMILIALFTLCALAKCAERQRGDG